MAKSRFIICLFFSISSIVNAQELNCNVSINNTGLVKNRTEEVYNNVQTSIQEFINSYVWTNDKFGNIEKIDCSISINVTEEVGNNAYKAEAVIQASRPVFNSSYATTTFFIRDPDFEFVYNDGEPLIFNEGTLTSQLTSKLAFYAFLILAIDYDSFQKYGGTALYKRAFEVANNAGWSDNGEYSRYRLINMIQRPDHEIFRRFIYEYHRLGLDPMYNDIGKGKNKINSTFRHLQKFSTDVPQATWLNIIFNCKRNEFANIIKALAPDKKEATIKMLNRIDINNKGIYNKVKK